MKKLLLLLVCLCFSILTQCQCGGPVVKAKLAPDQSCDPASQLPSLPAFKLFEGDKGERACLTMIWDNGTKQARSSQQVMLSSNGTLKGINRETLSFDQPLSLPQPKELGGGSFQVSVYLYVMRRQPDDTSTRATHEALCQRASIVGFACPSSTETDCWFSMSVPMTFSDTSLKIELQTKTCKVCVQEDCRNGEDDDCDGLVDTDDPECSSCRQGQERPCFSVSSAERNKGVCKDGVQKCGQDLKWGACENEVKPQKELCNGKDDNCDGEIDNFAAGSPEADKCCAPGSRRECYTGKPENAGVGACQKGIQSCFRNPDGSGSWSETCEGGDTAPSEETCNGIDDDCDGSVDENITRACYRGDPLTRNKGTCKDGTQSCQSNGQFGPCQGDVQPQQEICDGKDNDCNGQTDETFPEKDQPCTLSSALGPCASGTFKSCNAGQTVCVSDFKQEATDTCDDGIDNNCDGQIDEGCTCSPGSTQKCYSGPTGSLQGNCQQGTQTCQPDNKWGGCAGEVLPISEKCNNADDDCDGQTDENLMRPCYTGPSGSQGVGPCKGGSQTCSAGQWGKCAGEVTPAKELCNGKDDNCNGQTDETCVCQPGSTEPCYTGPGTTWAVKPCQKGTRTCMQDGQWDVCKGEVKPKKEDCNGQDDDCDGQVDNVTRSCYSGPTGTAGVGLCQEGAQACVNGKWETACQGEVKPEATDTCDGKDNDCDGKVDNTCACQSGQTQDCYSGPPGSENYSPCKKGSQTCANGQWGTCQGEVLPPGSETCNNVDDDCNGQTDENLTRPCYTGPNGSKDVGACQGGSQTCSAGKWGKCAGEVTPNNETCNNKDDDCDGNVDEELKRSCYTGPSGTSGTALCKAGTQTCTNGGWGPCAGEVTPGNETCNGQDDDCDGQVDESDPQIGQSCSTGTGLCLSVGQYACDSGALICKGATLFIEKCRDNLDNDCDGATDEICGESFTYAVVAKDGKHSHERGFNSSDFSKPGTGDYQSKVSDSNRRCNDVSAIVSAMGDKQISHSYNCDGDKHRTKTGKGDGLSGSEDWPYNIVVPRVTSGERFAVTSGCNSSLCNFFSGTNHNFSKSDFARISTGVYEIDVPECQSGPEPPIFVSVFRSSPSGFATAEVKNGHCYVYTFNRNGGPANFDFSIWMPDRTKVAWAIVDSTKASSNYIHSSNYFNDQNARWRASISTNNSSSKVYEVSFPAFTKNTAIFVTPRTSQPHSATPRSHSSSTFQGFFVQSRMIKGFGPTSAESFYVLFVQ